jgi:spore germination cell wall hydrolase CwlJ-like protein
MAIPYKTLTVLTDDELMARIAWGEARNQGNLGILAVCHVVLNRATDSRKRFGKSLNAVMLRKWAFSCINAKDPNAAKIIEGPKDDIIPVCRAIASLTLSGHTIDPTNGATHYFNPKIVNPFRSGAWKRGLMTYCAAIGSHTFYREV